MVWGLCANAQQPAVQLRETLIDPLTAPVALAWNSTALYLGIAIAPIFGGAVIGAAGIDAVPVGSALLLLVGVLAFQLGYIVEGRRASRIAGA